MWTFVRVIVFLALCLGPAPAWAQDDTASHAQMLELSDEGFEAFSRGAFGDAAQLFARAYETFPDPTLLKNEAIAWLRAGEHKAAVDAASRFLVQDSTEAADVAEVRKVWANAKLGLIAAALENDTLELAESLIAEVEGSDPDPVVTERLGILRIDLAKRHRERADRQAAEARRESERDSQTRELQLQRDIEAERAAQEQARAAAAQTELERQRQRRQTQLIGYGIAGLGGTVLIANAIYHLVALGWERQFYDLAENGGDVQRFEQLRDRLSVARVALPIFYTVGALSAGTGAWVVIRAGRNSDAERTEVEMSLRWVF